MNTLLLWTCLLGLSLTTTDSRSLQNAESSPKQRMDARKAAMFGALEEKFLKMLGLARKPVMTKDMKVPQYMLDLYNNQVEDEDYITTNFNFKDFSTTANTVRAYFHQDIAERDEPQHSRRRKRQVAMDVTTVRPEEELVRAEFRLYRGNVSRKSDYPRHIINVYQLLQSGVGTKSVKRLLDSQHVDDTTSEGWESFDVLQALQHWKENPAENHGLEVDIMSENGNPIDISHLRFDKPQGLDVGMWPHYRPLLAVFSKDPHTHHHERRITKRSSQSKAKQDSLCRRHDLSVNFTKLGWQWVEAPKVFDAYFCKGDCVFPATAHMNTTNHAIVQTMVYEVNSKKKKKNGRGNNVPRVCCIPTSYQSLAIMFHNTKEVLELKRFKEMIATGCGCR